jgi:hypothetical protein
MALQIDTTPLIEDALNALRNQTGLDAVADTIVQPMVDATIRITQGPKVWRFIAEVKPWLDWTIISLLKQRMRADTRDWILVTRYVTPAQADDLKAHNLAFLDTAGNAFINQQDLHIFIKGQKRTDNDKNRKTGFYRPADLKAIFGFLCMEGLEAKTHEEITEATGVGLGTVNRLIHALEQEGYVLRLKGRARRLVRKKHLLEQWVTLYPQRLRQKQMIGRFAGPQETWWIDIDPIAFNAQWGGEIAGRLLTQHLKPQTVTLYATKQPDALIVQQRLRKDAGGDVEILKRFWNFPTAGERADVVPALLVYADLLATGDDRNIETAQMVYEQHLAGLVREG